MLMFINCEKVTKVEKNSLKPLSNLSNVNTMFNGKEFLLSSKKFPKHKLSSKLYSVIVLNFFFNFLAYYLTACQFH